MTREAGRDKIRVGESLRIGMLSSPSTSGKTYEDPCPIQTRRDKRINLLQVGLVYDAELAKDSSPSLIGFLGGLLIESRHSLPNPLFLSLFIISSIILSLRFQGTSGDKIR